MGDSIPPTSRSDSARRERDALERLAREDAAEAATARAERSRLVRWLARIAGASIAVPLVLLAIKTTSPQNAQYLMHTSIAAGATWLVVIVVWLVFGRRSLRERRAAIKARRAGLCTCNYPRPPGMLKCPECGGEMVMR